MIRFWSKVAIGDGCWTWHGYCDKPTRDATGRAKLGYGQFRANGGMHKAHVVAFVLTCGPLPAGRVVGHTCDNAQCVRPSHLRAISQSANMREMHQRGRHPGFTKAAK